MLRILIIFLIAISQSNNVLAQSCDTSNAYSMCTLAENADYLIVQIAAGIVVIAVLLISTFATLYGIVEIIKFLFPEEVRLLFTPISKISEEMDKIEEEKYYKKEIEEHYKKQQDYYND